MRSKWLDFPTLGFALNTVLVAMPAWGMLPLLQISSVDSSLLYFFFFYRSIGFTGALLVFGIGCLLSPRHFNKDLTYLSLSLLGLGYLLLFGSIWLHWGSTSFFKLIVFLIGAGTSCSFIMWERIFASEEISIARRQMVIGTGLMAIIYLLISSTGQLTIFAIAVFACVLGDTCLIRKCSRNIYQKRTPVNLILPDFIDKDHLVGLINSTWRYVLSIAVIGYVSGASRALVPLIGEQVLHLNWALILGMVLSAVVLLILWDGCKLTFAFPSANGFILIAVATSFLILPILGNSFLVALAGFCAFAFSIASIFMMISSLEIARFKKIDPIAVFGLFSGCVYLLVSIGRGIVEIIGGSFTASQLLVVALTCIYLLSFAGAAVSFVRRDSDGFDPISLSIEGDHSNPLPGTQENVLNSAGDEEPNPDLDPFIRPVVVYQDMVPAYCRAIKKYYLLSNRETEVLELIIRGRDVARMAEILFVSQSTICTHCKNIYKKLGVHNKQQVMDLFENIRDLDDKDESLSAG